MWYRYRRGWRTPLWVWIMGLLGLKWLIRNSARSDWDVYRDKRRRFWQKIDEAFEVWRARDDAAPSQPPKTESECE